MYDRGGKRVLVVGFINSGSCKFSWLFHHFASPCYQWAVLVKNYYKGYHPMTKDMI